jgi:hypothetical protein
MGRIISLDTETFYDKDTYSVSKSGNWRYTHDDRFDCYMISVCDGSETWAGPTKDFNWESLRGAELLSHNAAFDSSVVRRLVELKLAPSDLYIPAWHCTANMTACLTGRRDLKNAASFLLGESVDKSVRDELSGKRWADLEADGTLDAALEYARRDAHLCYRLWTEFSPNWLPLERRISAHTIKMTERGFPVDRARLNADRATLEYALQACQKLMPWIEDGAKPTSTKAIAQKCRDENIPAPPVKSHDGGEEAFAAWEDAFSPVFPWIAAVARWRSINKMVGVIEQLEARIRDDGVLSYDLLYFGAHTGRVTGRGYNVLNMRKVPLYLSADYHWLEPDDEGGPPPGTAHIVDQRGWMVPPPGHLLGVVDSAQIEPRVAHYLAGNEPFLAQIRAGHPIYGAFAKQMGWYDNPGALKHDKAAATTYKTAKASVIGGGYGIGPGKFKGTAKKLANLDVTEERAREIITEYRAKNPEITGLWDRLSREFAASVGGDYEVELPSGRSMIYRNVRRDSKLRRDKKTGKVTRRVETTAEFVVEKNGTARLSREAMWGGSLLENIDQAFSRDLFMAQTLDVEDELGFPVLLHVYDEDVAAIPIDRAKEGLAAMIEVHRRVPDYASGLPLDAEGHLFDRYTK